MPSALHRLEAEDAVVQLRGREGTMARLGSEDGVPKLDWVEGVARLLENEAWLEEVEAEAVEIVDRGIRHIIWAGMGGSVMTVQVLRDMGLCKAGDAVAIHPLDSTDPVALNRFLGPIAYGKGPPPPAQIPIRELLADVMMIGVSMGMTSEEPITHLEWFVELLREAGLPADRHCLVMTLPGSYLERFAQERGLPVRPLQLDGGTGTGGRMSAPTTRVFLLPAALALRNADAPAGRLRAVLTRAWALYDLDLAGERPGEHPFVQLAAALSDASVDGACMMPLMLSDREHPLLQWIEQLMEESLGKGGKGVVVFDRGQPNPERRCYRAEGVLCVYVDFEPVVRQDETFVLDVLPLQFDHPEELLAGLAARFLGWQLTMALYGYLQGIQFAGQAAVEDYKARARSLRSGDPLAVAEAWGTALSGDGFTLFLPPGSASSTPVQTVVRALSGDCPSYLDLTINGEFSPFTRKQLRATFSDLGERTLGVPIKIRRAPAAYHSTEQSEMDGPPGLVSLRVVARTHEPPHIGRYTRTFLLAQAVGTWQAMVESGRACFLLVLDGTLDDGLPVLGRLINEIARALQESPDG